MKRYAKTHEYALADGDVVTVGISSAAAEELGELVQLELPKIGTILTQGEQFCTLESAKATQEIFAPVSGEIVAVNEDALKDISLVTDDAENRGWLVKVKVADLTELEKLFEVDPAVD